MTIAYLINQYPQPSHSFIRREIAALEAAGVAIKRFTLRRFNGSLVDPTDEAERQQTRVVLDIGIIRLVFSLLQTMILHPRQFTKTLRLTFQLGCRSNRGFFRHLAYLAEGCVLRRWLAECSTTHLHAHFGTNSAAVAMICRQLGGPPFSFTVHGPEEFDAPLALSLGEKVDRASFVIAVSWFGRAQLCRWAKPASWPKIHVIHCGVDDAFFDDPATSAPVAPRFVCVGRLEEQKGQLILLDAVASLVQSGISIELTLVGDGSMRPEIERRIREKGLTSFVHLSGWMSQAQVREKIRDSRALVLPSFAEGLPVVLMEALALTRPVIATAVAGVPELIETGVCGWLIPPGSSQALAQALQNAISADTEQLNWMGRAGRQRVLEKHSSAREAKQLANLFRTSASKEEL